MSSALSSISQSHASFLIRCCFSTASISAYRYASTLSTVLSNEASVTLTPGGLPRFHIPLPSRDETCIFSLRPLSNTIGDLAKAIEDEDKGIDRVVFLDNVNHNKLNSNWPGISVNLSVLRSLE